MASIAISYTDTSLSARAKELAGQLQLPLAEVTASNFDYLLTFAVEGLELRSVQDNYSPLRIDFLMGKMAFRTGKSTHKNELVAKAVGIKGAYRPYVLDATAGLGRDAFLLASLGCSVTMLERSPILVALLQDGIERLNKQLLNQHDLRFQLFMRDAKDYLDNLNVDKFPDVIYLDPMYPERKKSALVKKEMRILRDLVGDDTDFEKLFLLALERANDRVVVKRPRHANYSFNKHPHVIFTANNTRFDVYLCRREVTQNKKIPQST
jgi:16S rRNA (guanine1516-N2)-methyltransferase